MNVYLVKSGHLEEFVGWEWTNLINKIIGDTSKTQKNIKTKHKSI
jgi:hypothetical protein